MERSDSIQEEGQVGPPVHWAISGDCKDRPGSLSIEVASGVGTDPRHLSCVAIEEVLS